MVRRRRVIGYFWDVGNRFDRLRECVCGRVEVFSRYSRYRWSLLCENDFFTCFGGRRLGGGRFFFPHSRIDVFIFRWNLEPIRQGYTYREIFSLSKSFCAFSLSRTLKVRVELRMLIVSGTYFAEMFKIIADAMSLNKYLLHNLYSPRNCRIWKNYSIVTMKQKKIALVESDMWRLRMLCKERAKPSRRDAWTRSEETILPTYSINCEEHGRTKQTKNIQSSSIYRHS